MHSRNKYNSKKSVIDGITFDSKLEGRRYLELKRRQELGIISDLTLQPKFPLKINGKHVVQRTEKLKNGRKVQYYADFSYTQDGKTIIEDTKGFDTPVSKLKRAIVECIYNITITIIKKPGE